MLDNQSEGTGKKGGSHQVALSQLWNRVPNSDRQEIATIVAQMIARQIVPLAEEETSDDL